MKENTINPKDRLFNPYIIEERPLNITQLDVFSRLMMDRILFLSGEVVGDTMDTLVAQLLFLDSLNHDPIHLYINSAVIASSGEKGHRSALPYSRFMIHQPSSGIGYSTFKDQAIHLKEMESLKQDLYKVLADNSGQSLEEIEALCDRDKWMKADEAIQMGFLDNIVERKE